MKKEKYLADIDKVLTSFLSKKSKNLADKQIIPYSKELEECGHIKKLAFDVYKVNNDPYQDLWGLQEIDGKSYLVRDSDLQVESRVSDNWEAVSDRDMRNVTLSYKNTPIARFSSKDFGFAPKDIMTFKAALLDRIGSDNEFVKEVLDEQPESKRASLLLTFPEFKKFI